MSKISGQFQISGHFWNFRNFRTAGTPALKNASDYWANRLLSDRTIEPTGYQTIGLTRYWTIGLTGYRLLD